MAKSQINSITSSGAVKKLQAGTAASNSPEKAAAGTSSKKAGSKKQKSLDDVFETLLKDVYSAEQQLLKALPEMAEAAYTAELKDAFEAHLKQTRRHAERLDKVFQRLRISKNDIENCEAMEGLITEGKEIIEEFEEGPVRDSALIIGAQKIEHYEIASYGSLCELADVLGYARIADILDRTLEEEEETDKHLSSIAQNVNDEAYELAHEEEQDDEE